VRRLVQFIVAYDNLVNLNAFAKQVGEGAHDGVTVYRWGAAPDHKEYESTFRNIKFVVEYTEPDKIQKFLESVGNGTYNGVVVHGCGASNVEPKDCGHPEEEMNNDIC
jgi:hypothetical protein